MPNRKPAQFLIKITLMLVCIMGAFVFASSVQAAHCHDMSNDSAATMSPGLAYGAVRQSEAALPHRLEQHTVVQNMIYGAIDSVSITHDCCEQECYCPPISCGSAQGAPLTSVVLLFDSCVAVHATYLPSCYLHLPHTVHFKPPIQA